ncbi:MAG: UDP-glucose/GDP-mannose dehydrogenase family protein [Acidobacteriota bacterium]|nr:UDP-glucose/GDP-mannose dehydrogenase family protein [Acidobacteriota bacterium]
MKVSVIGLGYVGCVSAACLAEAGHDVIGVDVSQLKVDMIGGGHSPIIEPGISELMLKAKESKRLSATTDTAAAVVASDLSLICVGTPSQPNGSLDLAYIRRACQQIGEALASMDRYHVVVIRSTMLPGSIQGTVIPALESASGKHAGKDFGVSINPEFLREGSSIYDFNHPPFTLIGADDDRVAKQVSQLYTQLDAPVITIGIKEAEMVKYTSNCFHALKVSFANEIGNLCKKLGADSHKVMDVFCQDTKLNISPAYFKPGFAFGGSCLPKDLRAINYKAKELDVEVPVLSSILPSNRQQVERTVDMVLSTGRKNVGILGLSFKSGTDDLRESPMVTLVETLLGKGLKLTIYDRDVQMARLVGANKEYIEREIPHISSLLKRELDEVIDSSELVIIGKKEDEFRQLGAKLNNGRLFIDLVGMLKGVEHGGGYEGICW